NSTYIVHTLRNFCNVFPSHQLEASFMSGVTPWPCYLPGYWQPWLPPPSARSQQPLHPPPGLSARHGCTCQRLTAHSTSLPANTSTSPDCVSTRSTSRPPSRAYSTLPMHSVHPRPRLH